MTEDEEYLSTLSKEEQLRLRALSAALAISKVDATTFEVIEKANRFYDWVGGQSSRHIAAAAKNDIATQWETTGLPARVVNPLARHGISPDMACRLSDDDLQVRDFGAKALATFREWQHGASNPS